MRIPERYSLRMLHAALPHIAGWAGFRNLNFKRVPSLVRTLTACMRPEVSESGPYSMELLPVGVDALPRLRFSRWGSAPAKRRAHQEAHCLDLQKSPKYWPNIKIESIGSMGSISLGLVAATNSEQHARSHNSHSSH